MDINNYYEIDKMAAVTNGSFSSLVVKDVLEEMFGEVKMEKTNNRYGDDYKNDDYLYYPSDNAIFSFIDSNGIDRSLIYDPEFFSSLCSFEFFTEGRGTDKETVELMKSILAYFGGSIYMYWADRVIETVKKQKYRKAETLYIRISERLMFKDEYNKDINEENIIFKIIQENKNNTKLKEALLKGETELKEELNNCFKAYCRKYHRRIDL